jgi:hypothetical protein
MGELLSKAVNFATEHSTATRILLGVIAALAGGILALNAGMKAYAVVSKAIPALTKAWAAVQWLLNAALLANPIVLIVAGIIALVAIIAVIVQKTIGWGKIWDWLKSVASKAWDAIKKGISALVAWFSSLPGRIKKAIGNLGKLLLDKGKDILRGLLNGVKWLWNHSLVGYIVNRRQAIVRAIGNVGRLLFQKGKDVLNGLKNGAAWVWNHTVRPYLRLGSKIKSAVGGLGSTLFGAGKAVLKGLYDGLVWAWKNYVQPYLSWVTDRIPDWKGPKVRDAKLLVESGRLIMGSLVKGFDDGAGRVERYLNRFTSGIPGMVEVSATGLTPVGAGGGSQTITVRLTAEQVSQLQRGREIQADLDAYRSAGGRARS